MEARINENRRTSIRRCSQLLEISEISVQRLAVKQLLLNWEKIPYCQQFVNWCLDQDFGEKMKTMLIDEAPPFLSWGRQCGYSKWWKESEHATKVSFDTVDLDDLWFQQDDAICHKVEQTMFSSRSVSLDGR